MMSTNADAQTGPLLDLTLSTAICDMLDRDAGIAAPMPAPAPMPTQGTRPTVTLLR
jgi:hypothetical protein